jgi:hypothetical protein
VSIWTTQLDVQFDVPAIDRDFVILRFQRQVGGKWYGAPMLDRLLADFNAESVLFRYGPYAYALFRRPVDVRELRARLRDHQDFAEAAVEQAIPLAEVDKSERCACCAEWLAQLLVNSLSSSQSRIADFHFCNLTGECYLLHPALSRRKGVLDALAFRIADSYVLETALTRFRTSAPEHFSARQPHYVLAPATRSLRRVFSPQGQTTLYVRRGLSGTKAEIPFVDFSSAKAFHASRAGCIRSFLQLAQKRLAPYLELSPGLLDVDHVLALNSTVIRNDASLRRLMLGRRFRVVDKVRNGDSQKLSLELRRQLVDLVPDPKQVRRAKLDSRDAVNLCIVHRASYYSENGESDPYDASTDAIQRQHVTIEDFGSDPDAGARTLVKEMLIKDDLAKGQLTLFDWPSLGCAGDWTFGLLHRDHSDRNAPHHYAFMSIQPDGKFTCEWLRSDDLFDRPDYDELTMVMEAESKDDWRRLTQFDGLVMTDRGDINAIVDTGVTTLPDLEAIASRVETNAADWPPGITAVARLTAILGTFAGQLKHRPDDLLRIEALRASLGPQLPPKRGFAKLLNKHLGVNSKLARAMRQFLLEEHGIRLTFGKSREDLEQLFAGQLDIKYYGETDTDALYFVGSATNSVKFSFKSACHIRRVKALRGQLVFRELLPTMNVDFVRTGQSTVLPFPFKYLREFTQFVRHGR